MSRYWTQMLGSALLLTGLTTYAVAQDAGRPAGAASKSSVTQRSGRGGFGFLATLDRTVGLSAEQRDTVRGLLATQREKTDALRRDTDVKIRDLLNADQQKKFDALRAEQQSRRKRIQR